MNQTEISNKFRLIKKLCNDDPNNKATYLELFNSYLRRQVELDLATPP